jgi:hypothetical protein
MIIQWIKNKFFSEYATQKEFKELDKKFMASNKYKHGLIFEVKDYKKAFTKLFDEELKKLKTQQEKFEKEKSTWIISPHEISSLKSLARKEKTFDSFQNRVIALEEKLDERRKPNNTL